MGKKKVCGFVQCVARWDKKTQPDDWLVKIILLFILYVKQRNGTIADYKKRLKHTDDATGHTIRENISIRLWHGFLPSIDLVGSSDLLSIF